MGHRRAREPRESSLHVAPEGLSVRSWCTNRRHEDVTSLLSIPCWGGRWALDHPAGGRLLRDGRLAPCSAQELSLRTAARCQLPAVTKVCVPTPAIATLGFPNRTGLASHDTKPVSLSSSHVAAGLSGNGIIAARAGAVKLEYRAPGECVHRRQGWSPPTIACRFLRGDQHVQDNPGFGR